ncbi:MAG: hypothetical protein ACRDL1_10870 [Solirubrobacterales bacterium]
MTRTRLLSLAAVSLLGAGLIAGCGGGGGGDEDPQEVLDETFSNDEAVNSGVLDLSLAASAEGEEGGSFDASLSGAFQGEEDEEGEFPQFDLSASLSGEGDGQSIDFEGGLIATADAAFVSYQGTTYEVPKQLFDEVKQLSEQAQSQAQSEGGEQDAGAIFDQFGIDPSTWLTEPENEGDEDVEGTETIHIHADANVPQIVEDIQTASEQTGTGEQIPPETVEQVEDAVEEASIDVYSGKDDRLLRRLDLNLAITPPEDSDAGVDSVDLEFSLTFSDVNEEQTIEAPSDAQPFSQLESDLGLPPGLLEGALGGGLGGGSLGGGGGGGGLQLPGGGGGGGAPSQEYLNCISQAQTPEELQACNP